MKSHLLKISILTLLFIICVSSSAQNNSETEYRVFIESADQYFNDNNFDQALNFYQKALGIDPEATYPRKQIEKINETLADEKSKNILFEIAITSAEKWFKEKKYKLAKQEYLNAIKINPKAQYPKDRLAHINKIWSDPEVEKAYADAIEKADDLYAEYAYEKSREEYLTASELKPYEEYPLERILEINALLEKQKNTEEQYREIIARADKAIAKLEYDDARKLFQQALEVRPEDPVSKKKILEIDNIMANQEKTLNAYEQKIAEADEFYMNKEFQKAKTKYQEAMGIMPEKRYPNSMLEKIDPLIAKQKDDNNKYSEAIANGDRLFNASELRDALNQYKIAQEIKPEEKYPENKIEEINALLQEQNILETKFSSLIKTSDSLFGLEEYNAALLAAKEAGKLKPDHQKTQDKINEISGLIQNIKNTENLYSNTILKADQAFNSQEYQQALEEYQKAAETKPNEEYPKKQIAIVNDKIKELNKLNEQYSIFLLDADKLMESGKLFQAKEKYNEALELKPSEKYPQQKISEINQIIQKDQTDRHYASLISAANDFFNKKDYIQAKSKYSEALSLKADEKYPDLKIKEIDAILLQIENTNNAYNNNISIADSLFNISMLYEAESHYKEALSLKPDSKYAKEQIENIIKRLQEQSNIAEKVSSLLDEAEMCYTRGEYKKAIAYLEQARELNPDNDQISIRITEIKALQNEQEQLREAYNIALNQADKAYSDKNYDQALEAYLKASGFMPEQKYPQEKISEIEDILNEQNRTNFQFNKEISIADSLFNLKRYESALKHYEAASKIKKDEIYPKTRIEETKNLLAELEQTNKEYDKLISSADKYYEKEMLEQALFEYQEAAALKPLESYPEERISEITNSIDEEKTKELKYKKLISTADQYFADGKYQEAIQSYRSASEIKPQEEYPIEQEQIALKKYNELKGLESDYNRALTNADAFYKKNELQRALGEYRKATELKPEEKYPQQKILDIEKQISLDKKMAEYSDAMADGNSYFKSKDYEKAMSSFNEALKIFPKDSLALDKISLIQKEISELESREKNYNQAIASGDEQLNMQKYEEALQAYQTALSYKDEKYPALKISEITEILKKIKSEKDKYNSLVDEGNSLITAKEYKKAITAFENASEISPEEKYPKQKILEINELIEEERINTRYNELITMADDYFNTKKWNASINTYQSALELKPQATYPKKRIEDLNTIIENNRQAIEEAYMNAIADADQAYELENHKIALEKYKEALDIKPSESYARNRVNELEAFLQEKERAMQKAYLKAVAMADNLYHQKILDEAIDAYKNASNINPDDDYPYKMIGEIRKYMEEHTLIKITETKTLIPGNTDIKYSFDPVNVRQRKNNYIVIKGRSETELTPKVYLSYGEDGMKNGGIVLKNIQSGEANEYILRVSAQDRWYRYDNNWLKIYSEGSGFEISSIQISSGD